LLDVGIYNLAMSRWALQHCPSTNAGQCAEPTHIQVYELWTDADSLAAHFRHPNYTDMVRVLRSNPGFLASANRLWAADDRGPVYGPDGAFRHDAVADAG